MSDKFRNTYRIESTRLKNWDYGWDATYFITICTKNREYFFGDVTDGIMRLSKTGKIAHDCWLAIPERFPFVRLANHVVMPNHVHGMVIIDKSDDQRNIIETRLIPSLQNQQPPSPKQPPVPSAKRNGGFAGDKNPMLHENLSTIIRWFKGRTTFESRKIHAGFAWQPRFHDHIIRDEKSFYNISRYIKNNPANWSDDRFFK